MVEGPMSDMLQQVADDVAALPLGAVQLVGAIVSMQHGLPGALSEFIMTQLALRTDMHTVSPAAEAVMRLCAYSDHSDMEFAKLDIQMQHSLLRALALDDKVLVAAAFMSRLADRVAVAAPFYSASTLSPVRTGTALLRDVIRP